MNDSEVIQLPTGFNKVSVFVRNFTSDVNVFQQIFEQMEYDIEYPGNIATIIDLGANIGLASVFFACRFPEARIVAIEPDTSNFKMAVRNTEPFPLVKVIQGAIWPYSAVIAVQDSGDSHWAITTSLAENDVSAAETVQGYTVPDLMKIGGLTKIDILKMDIEGAEQELLNARVDEWLPHVGILLIETHDRMKEGCTNALFKALGKHTYEFSVKGENLVFVFDR